LGDALTPLEAWTGETLKLQWVGYFGAIGYKHTPKQLRTKWEPNSQRCVFVGYEGTNQYRVLINKQIHITRDLTLLKQTPQTDPKLAQREKSTDIVQISDESEDDVNEVPSVSTPTTNPQPRSPSPKDPDPPPQTSAKPITPGQFPPDTPEDALHVRPQFLPNPPHQEVEYSQRPRRNTAGRFSSTQFHDEEFSPLVMSSNPDPLPGTYCHAYQSSLASETEPTTYNQAITGPNSNQWKLAIDVELTSLEENNT